MTSETITVDPLADYAPEADMARVRKVTARTLRAERQRGDGPPFVKLGKRTYYPLAGFRAWLQSLERQPVRSGR